jgi:hypothetical protein
MTPQENARLIALTLANGDKERLRPGNAPNSFLVVNFPEFDTRSWDRNKKGKRRDKSSSQQV